MHVGRQPVSCGMRPIAVLLTLLLGMVHSGSFAQVHPSEASADRLLFTARHFGVTDGLPHRHITSITQDQRGFIWAATPQGLARFDGYGFRNFTMADGLASNAVRKVACDGNGELWVLHDNGSLDIIDARSIRVRNVHDRFEGVEPQLGTGPVLDLISNREGVIVFAQEKYLIRYGDPGHPFQTVAIECPGAILLSRLTDGGDLWYNCGSVPDAEWPVDLVSQRFTAPDGSASPKELVRIRDRNGVVTNPGRDHSGWKPTGMGGTYVVDSQCGPALSGWIRPLGVTIEPSPPSPGMVVQLEGHGSVRMPLSDDIWLINTGYQYPVEDDISLYMEAGPAVGSHSEQAGFNISSGVRYRLSPSLNIGSQLKQLEVSKPSTLVELNSSLLVTPQLAITANYGLSAFSTEQFLTLGVGFNF